MTPATAIARLGLFSLAVSLAGCATTGVPSGSRPDSFALGRNAAGEPCSARRNYEDAALNDIFDKSFAVTCRNVSSSRALALVRLVEASGPAPAAIAATQSCGETTTAELRGLGTASVRRCFDRSLGTPSVSISVPRGDQLLLASASDAVLGPTEEALRIVAGIETASRDPRRDTSTSIVAASLPPAPANTAPAEASAAFDPALALAQGISFNHKGLHVEASRVLNDALSRLPADAPPATRAELLLEAALADSNIRFRDAADERFRRAEELIATNAEARTPFLQRKRDAYRALDLLNRRRFRDALAALDKLASAPVESGQPLMDPALIRELNQPRNAAGDASAAVAVPDTQVLSQLVLDGQTNWARSVALLAIGDEVRAAQALDAAQAAYAPLSRERIDQIPVLWLGARIERQRGRLAARRGDYPSALAAFDRSLDDLRRSAIGTGGTDSEPAIAETALERAGVYADSGVSPELARAEYDKAVDLLITASRQGGGTLPVGIERYMDLLVAEAQAGAKPDTYERYFRAMQAVGEPAVARQLSQLQNVVTADPEVGVKVRDRAELEREITRLRYDIAANDGTTPLATLERDRAAAEAKLLAIDSELAANSRVRAIDDSPATLADLRAALKPGEAFLKLTELNRRTYAVVIAGDQTFIYPLELTTAQAKTVADQLRASIDIREVDGRRILPRYEVGIAYALFRLVAGPARDALLASNSLIVDPAGPLESLPMAVLVATAPEPGAPPITRDYSKVDFLARRLRISTAVSPRSFLVARALAPSQAPQPFMGFAQHVPPAGGADRNVSVGFGCNVPYDQLRRLASSLAPIDAKEIAIASQALGLANPPELVGQAFSDTAVIARNDLDQFEVLHFATHGLEEGVWGCDKSPPALVTSFGDANSDGLLSFDEIARLRLDANLVVLSACDTASGVENQELARRSGQEEAGQTLEGLVRAFLTANSRAVLATYWQATAGAEADVFVRTFYSSARDKDIGGALQDAQRALIDTPEYSHPFRWGPFFLVGDASKSMLSGAARQRLAGK